MRARSWSARKHPRSRGEDGPTAGRRCFGPETPPLTRGRPVGSKKKQAAWGNTPAHAGKTRSIAPECFFEGKHPRSRGEDAQKSTRFDTTRETPPLTRGRLLRTSIRTGRRRNTPAHAGKTEVEVPCGRCIGKHPRSRGEDWRHKEGAWYQTETPPLTRGRPPALRPRTAAPGNTPAHAGKTILTTVFGWRRRKHPRSRGEDR